MASCGGIFSSTAVLLEGLVPCGSVLPLLVSSGNNILVLPEWLSQTPASVILLPGEDPLSLALSVDSGCCHDTQSMSAEVMSPRWLVAGG